MSESTNGASVTLRRPRGAGREGKAERRQRKARPLKYPQIFTLLRDAADRLAIGNRPDAIDLAGKAAEWAAKWTHNHREETSMGQTISKAIQANIIDPLAKGAATPKGMNHAINVLERVVEREAKVRAVGVAQAQLRLQYRGKTPDEARERAVMAALRMVRQALVSGAD